MKLPSVPRKGFSVAKLCSEIIAFMRSSRIVSVTGGKLKQTPNGQIIEIPKQAPHPPTIAPPLWVSVFYDGSAWKYHVNEGHVIHQNMTVADKLTYYTPTLGGTALDAETPPTGTLPSNTCYIYVNVITTNKGAVNGTPTIVASSTEQTNVHHVPPNPESSSGTAGNYYFLIAEFQESTESELASPRTVRRLPGNKLIPNQLIEIENVGGAVEIYRQYLAGGDDKHELRTLKERASSPQVNVKYENEGFGDPIDAESIVIEGNGYANSGGGFATVQSVDDGLVTGFTDFSFGHDGDVVVWDPGNVGYYTLVFEKGNLRSSVFTEV